MSFIFWRALYSYTIDRSPVVDCLRSRRRCPMGIVVRYDVTVTSRVCGTVIGWSFQLSPLFTCDYFIPVYGTYAVWIATLSLETCTGMGSREYRGDGSWCRGVNFVRTGMETIQTNVAWLPQKWKNCTEFPQKFELAVFHINDASTVTSKSTAHFFSMQKNLASV